MPPLPPGATWAAGLFPFPERSPAMLTATAVSASPLERHLAALGFHHEPLAPVADIQAVAETPCPGCEQTGSSELLPYWRGPELRLVIRCCHCGHEMEG